MKISCRYFDNRPLRPCRRGTKFTARAGCHDLKQILNLEYDNGTFARWDRREMEENFDILHPAGVQHQAVDALF